MAESEARHFARAMGEIVSRVPEIEGDSPAHNIVRDAASSMRSQVTRLASRTQALQGVDENRDPTQPEAAHAKAVAERARELERDAEKAVDEANKAHRQALLQVHEILDSELVPNEYASEMRAHFRSLDSKAQMDLFQRLLKGRRSSDVAAILNAPAEVVGLEPEVHGRLREQYYNAVHPEAVAARDALSQSFDTTLTAARTAKRAKMSLTDPQKLRDIERREQMSAQARQTFESAGTDAA